MKKQCFDTDSYIYYDFKEEFPNLDARSWMVEIDGQLFTDREIKEFCYKIERFMKHPKTGIPCDYREVREMSDKVYGLKNAVMTVTFEGIPQLVKTGVIEGHTVNGKVKSIAAPYYACRAFDIEHGHDCTVFWLYPDITKAVSNRVDWDNPDFLLDQDYTIRYDFVTFDWANTYRWLKIAENDAD